MLFVYIPTIILKYDYFWVCECEKHIVVTICYILYSYIIRTAEPVLEKYNRNVRNYLKRKQYMYYHYIDIFCWFSHFNAMDRKNVNR